MAQFWLPGDSDFALALREPNLLVPGKRPTGQVKVNPNHELAPYLRMALIGSNLIAFGRDTVTFSRQGTAYLDPVLGYVSPDGDANYFSTTTIPSWINNAIVNATWAGRFANATASDGGIFAWSNGSNRTGINIFNNRVYWAFFEVVGSFTTSLTNNTTHNITMTYDSAASAGNMIKGYVDNSNVYSGDPSIGSGTVDRILIGAYPYTTGNFSFPGNSIEYAFLFDTTLTADQERRLHDDPYSLFVSANDAPFIVGTAAAGGVTLTVQDATHGHTADIVALTQANQLVVNETSHAHTADSVALTQAHSLAVDEATHGHIADNVDLNVSGQIVVQDATHAHAADSVALTQANILAVADADHQHTADAVVLEQAHVLVVADTAHAHTADNVVLTIGGALDVQAALHAHTVVNIDLTQAGQLTVADALHGHSVDSVVLVEANVLAPADALHGHTADEPTLDITLAIVPADATHGHTAEQVTLAQANILAVEDALHAHSVDNIDLSQGFTLVVSDALHAHLADSPALILGTLPLMSGRVYLSRATLRVYKPTRRLDS